MAQETPDATSPPPAGRKESKPVYLWSRSTNGPVGEGAPGSETPEPTTTTTTTSSGPKLNPQDFQKNFPADGSKKEQLHGPGVPSISEAVKSIKSEDFLTVSQTPCARNGFLAGIASGVGLGGVRYVFMTSPIKSANWAVGGFLAGSAGFFEYCQWKRRQERIKMKRTVEVYQETLADKRRREAERLEQKKLEEEALKASQRPWYKFW